MVEEQHVTHYGALLDPTCSWLENLLLREYQECYLYWSFYTSEVDSWTKKMWELHFEQEVAHLHHAAELLKKYEGKEWQEVIPDGTFPDLLHFTPMKDYIRDILKNQVTLTAEKETFKDISDIPENYEFYTYQKLVNHALDEVVSHTVIEEYQKENGEDYRSEDKPNPVKELRDRTKDNTRLGRVA